MPEFEKVTVLKEVKVKPCKTCKSKNIRLHDCGYSSFNVGGGECLNCGKCSTSQNISCNPTKKELARIWNDGQKPTEIERLKAIGNRDKRKLAKLRKQLRDAGIDPCA